MSRAVFVFTSILVSVLAMNRPVYKIVLTQKGYAQFLQYDVVTPPLTEFTFCTWIRVYDLAGDQTVFTYVANGNNRVARLWLDSGGRHMKFSMNGKVASTMVVEIVKDVWRHVCLSYQSDHGAWALYLDSRLVSCEADPSLRGYVLPGGGSVIIGYGTAISGASNGFEGEIFGANMILSSTIERNFTMKGNPIHDQKRFPKNKLKSDSNYNNYVILSELLNERTQNNFRNIDETRGSTTKSYNNYERSHSGEEGTRMRKNKAALQEDFDYTISEFTNTNTEKNDFWSTAGNPRFTFADVYKSQAAGILSNSATKLVPTVSEYETPPPPSKHFYFPNIQHTPESTPQTIHHLNNNFNSSARKIYKPMTELFDIEVPPPPEVKNTRVYGQWTSSKYAGTVLNYLKSINFNNRIVKKVPQTIPFHKISDSHPYPSDFKLNILRPPPQFKNRKVVEKRYDIIRRKPQINVHILEDDLRLNIIKMHAETQPKQVEITSSDSPKKQKEHRFYRDAEPKFIEETNSAEQYQPKEFILKEERKNNHRYFVQPTSNKSHSSKLPFLKSFEYYMKDFKDAKIYKKDIQDTYKNKNLSQGNKWHNAKSYNNDYTPRKLNLDFSDSHETRAKHFPSVRLKYKPSPPKEKDSKVDPFILHGRNLATQVSNQSFVPQDSVSILKYNDGYLPARDWTKRKIINDGDIRNRTPSKRNMKASNFDQQVKIGNALNERILIGVDEGQKKRSFEGGDDIIPDINKYRSEIDNVNVQVPPSLGPRACKNVELYDRVLYVQPDESIDLTHILSPLREKNIAIEFVMQNYKKCSLTDSSFQKNALLLIDWSKTPVRLFGGAHPRTTTDLCGFF